jgi:hypothetical protein
MPLSRPSLGFFSPSEQDAACIVIGKLCRLPLAFAPQCYPSLMIGLVRSEHRGGDDSRDISTPGARSQRLIRCSYTQLYDRYNSGNQSSPDRFSVRGPCSQARPKDPLLLSPGRSRWLVRTPVMHRPYTGPSIFLPRHHLAVNRFEGRARRSRPESG